MKEAVLHRQWLWRNVKVWLWWNPCLMMMMSVFFFFFSSVQCEVDVLTVTPSSGTGSGGTMLYIAMSLSSCELRLIKAMLEGTLQQQQQISDGGGGYGGPRRRGGEGISSSADVAYPYADYVWNDTTGRGGMNSPNIGASPSDGLGDISAGEFDIGALCLFVSPSLLNPFNATTTCLISVNDSLRGRCVTPPSPSPPVAMTVKVYVLLRMNFSSCGCYNNGGVNISEDGSVQCEGNPGFYSYENEPNAGLRFHKELVLMLGLLLFIILPVAAFYLRRSRAREEEEGSGGDRELEDRIGALSAAGAPNGGTGRAMIRVGEEMHVQGPSDGGMVSTNGGLYPPDDCVIIVQPNVKTFPDLGVKVAMEVLIGRESDQHQGIGKQETESQEGSPRSQEGSWTPLRTSYGVHDRVMMLAPNGSAGGEGVPFLGVAIVRDQDRRSLEEMAMADSGGNDGVTTTGEDEPKCNRGGESFVILPPPLPPRPSSTNCRSNACDAKDGMGDKNNAEEEDEEEDDKEVEAEEEAEAAAAKSSERGQEQKKEGVSVAMEDELHLRGVERCMEMKDADLPNVCEDGGGDDVEREIRSKGVIGRRGDEAERQRVRHEGVCVHGGEAIARDCESDVETGVFNVEMTGKTIDGPDDHKKMQRSVRELCSVIEASMRFGTPTEIHSGVHVAGRGGGAGAAAVGGGGRKMSCVLDVRERVSSSNFSGCEDGDADGTGDGDGGAVPTLPSLEAIDDGGKENSEGSVRAGQRGPRFERSGRGSLRTRGKSSGGGMDTSPASSSIRGVCARPPPSPDRSSGGGKQESRTGHVALSVTSDDRSFRDLRSDSADVSAGRRAKEARATTVRRRSTGNAEVRAELQATSSREIDEDMKEEASGASTGRRLERSLSEKNGRFSLRGASLLCDNQESNRRGDSDGQLDVKEGRGARINEEIVGCGGRQRTGRTTKVSATGEGVATAIAIADRQQWTNIWGRSEGGGSQVGVRDRSARRLRQRGGVAMEKGGGFVESELETRLDMATSAICTTSSHVAASSSTKGNVSQWNGTDPPHQRQQVPMESPTPLTPLTPLTPRGRGERRHDDGDEPDMDSPYLPFLMGSPASDGSTPSSSRRFGMRRSRSLRRPRRGVNLTDSSPPLLRPTRHFDDSESLGSSDEGSRGRSSSLSRLARRFNIPTLPGSVAGSASPAWATEDRGDNNAIVGEESPWLPLWPVKQSSNGQ